MTTFVLAGGCFWCLDAVFRTLDGVTQVESGYTGGDDGAPDLRRRSARARRATPRRSR